MPQSTATGAMRAVRTLATKLRVTVCPGAVHVYPLVPAPEGRAEARRIVEKIARG